jgi:hypothetical protein
MQILDCPYVGGVIGLTLNGAGLKGILPANLSALPLQYINLRDNPHLHGSVPLDIATPDLWGLEITNTSLNCHDDMLSHKDLVSFASKLHNHPHEDWALKTWSPGEMACINTMGSTDKDWSVIEISEPRNSDASLKLSKSCRDRFFPGSFARLPTNYVLGVGCTCAPGTSMIFRGKGSVLDVLCQEFQYMWYVEIITFTLVMLYVCAVACRVAENNNSVFVVWAKQRSQPGTLHMEGSVCFHAL